MTQSEQIDRLERCLQLFLKRPERDRREARTAAAKLEAYVIALREYDTAKQDLAAKRDDSEMIETVRLAREVLDRVREELRH
jgi:hypothetical protein